MAEEGPYKKDMHDARWDRVYQRQEARGELAAAWFDRLGLGPGSHLLDVGCGPGYFSLLAARRVGPAGRVLALDRSAAALAYLRDRLAAAGLDNVDTLEGDAAALPLGGAAVAAALLTFVLHHADDPAGLLRNLARGLAPGTPLLVAEFDPLGPGAVGPPLAERLDAAAVAVWLAAAGFTVAERWQQTPEHYALLARRV